MQRRLKLLIVLMVAWAFVAVAEDAELDAYTGLKMSDDWELVRNNCIACHSPKLITQQRGSAGQWLNMIRWMQAKQNLWQFDPDTEQKIINYLATNYPPQDDRRRAAIPLELMPPNPYAPPSQQQSQQPGTQ
jgi:mono/diheme cytochrome c family protein